MASIKKILRIILSSILIWEARLILKKYQPRIIGITGNVGKTGTKDAIYSVLQSHYRVRKSEKSYNSEIGLSLTIMGCHNAWYNPIAWIKNIAEGLSLILFRSEYPEWLVLEIGADRPGDIARVAKWLKLDVAVITRVPAVPVHVEFFPSAKALVAEKLILIKALKKDGVAILNYDDEQIMSVTENLKSRLLTYGLQEGALVRGSNSHLYYQDRANKWHWPEGITFKVDYEGNNVPLHLLGVLGVHQIYSVLGALAVGLSQKINLVDLAESLKNLELPPGRMRLLLGIKETLIIDDSYNSSPAALEAALETLGEITTTGRRIAVLGDMMELGVHTIDAHKEAGIQVAQHAHELVTIGLRSKFIADEAAKKKMGKKKLHHFDDAREAGVFLQNYIASGDVILVKGSQSMRMERVVEEIMAYPDDKANLLVRQDEQWLRK